MIDPEEYMREFLSRQREIGKKSLEAVSGMAKSNVELIAMNSMNKLHPLLTVSQAPHPEHVVLENLGRLLLALVEQGAKGDTKDDQRTA